MNQSVPIFARSLAVVLLSALLLSPAYLTLAAAPSLSHLERTLQQDEPVLATATTLAFRMGAYRTPGVGSEVVVVLPQGSVVEIISFSDDGRWAEVLVPGEEDALWMAELLLAYELADEAVTAADAPEPDSAESDSAESDSAEPETAEAEADETDSNDEQTPEQTSETVNAAATVVIPTADPAADPTADPATNPTASPTDVPTETVGEEAATPAVAAPTATPSVPPTPSVPTAYTQPARMNVRSGPGLAYNIVTSVPQGTAARIIGVGPSNQWWQVDLETLEEPVWLFRDLTTTGGVLTGIVQLSEEEIPPRPTVTPTPEAVAQEAPASAPAQRAPAQVANAPLPTGGGGFGYGIQAHMVHTGQEGMVMEKTRELGFGWVKQQIEWKIFESSQGQYGFGDIGPIVGAANLAGVNLLFSVVNAPDWAREPGFDPNVGGPPQDPNTYAAFVGRLAGEYCGTSLKAIEVWNEQNLHYEWGNKPLNPAEYMNLLRPAYAAIKAACPSMTVVSGAPTPAGNNGNFAMDDFTYLEQMFQNGLARYADAIGAHPSGYNVPPSVTWQDACGVIQQTGNSFNGACDNPHHSWSFRSTMEGYRNIAVVYGASNLRIWPTEFGWAAGGAFDPRYAYANDNSYEEQAAWTVEAYQMMRGWGWVGPAFLWNLNFRVVANGTEKAQWGIVTNDWRPLPAFYALRDMGK